MSNDKFNEYFSSSFFYRETFPIPQLPPQHVTDEMKSVTTNPEEISKLIKQPPLSFAPGRDDMQLPLSFAPGPNDINSKI